MKKQTKSSRERAINKIIKELKITLGEPKTLVEGLGEQWGSTWLSAAEAGEDDNLHNTKGGAEEKVKEAAGLLVAMAAGFREEEVAAFLKKAFESRGIEGDWNTIARDFKIVVEEKIRGIVEVEVKKRLRGDYPLSTQVIKQTLNPKRSDGNASFVCKDEHKLTAAHFKLEHTFLSILEETSSDKNPKSDDFFTGNMGAEILNVNNERGQEIALKQAQTRVKPKDIYRAYYGKSKISGAERKNVWRIIEEYRNLTFTWSLEAVMPDGKIFKADIKRPRVNVDLVSLTDRETAEKIEAGDETSREAEQWLILNFHAAFLAFKYDGGKYSKTPKNLNAILETAAGGAKKVTAAHYRGFHYLNSLRSTRKGEGVFETEINREGLIEKLGLSHHWESRNGAKGEAALAKVVADLQKAGLIQSHTQRAGNTGSVYSFALHISPKWLEPGAAKKG